MFRIILLLLTALFALSLSACSSSTAKGSIGDSCTSTGDCRGGLRCKAGVCAAPKVGDPCQDDKDCGDLKCDKQKQVCVGIAPDGGQLDGPLGDLPVSTPDLPAVTSDKGAGTGCTASSYGYVFNRVLVPSTSSESLKYALQHKGKYYNSLGGILALLTTQAPTLDMQGNFDEAVCKGTALHLLCVDAKSLSSAPSASAQLWPATKACCTTWPCFSGGQCSAAAKSACFSGSASLSPTAGYAAPVVPGSISGGVVSIGPGKAKIYIPVFGSAGSTPVATNLKGATITGTISSSGIISGVFAGAIDKYDLDNVVVPQITAAINSSYTSSATAQSTKDLLKSLFDTNKDGQITLAEVKSNGLIKTFLDGDVDVDGDGIKELSLGVGFTAVSAKIQP